MCSHGHGRHILTLQPVGKKRKMTKMMMKRTKNNDLMHVLGISPKSSRFLVVE
jgi:hypothetical protein